MINKMVSFVWKSVSSIEMKYTKNQQYRAMTETNTAVFPRIKVDLTLSLSLYQKLKNENIPYTHGHQHR
jgi:hypothetical protein